MLSCQDFKQWLRNQRTADENTFRHLMGHIQACQTCSKLYQADMALDELLRKGMQPVEPPRGLIARARQRIESQSRPRSTGFFSAAWKTAVPALSISALVLVVLLNSFSPGLQSMDEVAAHSIANHLNTGMENALLADDVTEVAHWLTQRLGHEVRLPDLKRLGLKLLGGRKCSLGKTDAALLFCDSGGSRVSLFVIRQNDVDVRVNPKRKYIVVEGDHTVTVWQESGRVYALVI